jgi:hypothetical protein
LTVIGTPCSGPHTSPRASAASAARARSRALLLPGDDRVQRRVAALGAREKEVQQFQATDPPVADLLGQTARRSKGALVHRSVLPDENRSLAAPRAQGDLCSTKRQRRKTAPRRSNFDPRKMGNCLPIPSGCGRLSYLRTTKKDKRVTRGETSHAR